MDLKKDNFEDDNELFRAGGRRRIGGEVVETKKRADHRRRRAGVSACSPGRGPAAPKPRRKSRQRKLRRKKLSQGQAKAI